MGALKTKDLPRVAISRTSGRRSRLETVLQGVAAENADFLAFSCLTETSVQHASNTESARCSSAVPAIAISFSIDERAPPRELAGRIPPVSLPVTAPTERAAA